ncbi:MAG: hypothetical protein U0840_23035 [Gemmataceae bacterium]
MAIEQAIYRRNWVGEVRLAAHSPGFHATTQELTRRLCQGFGAPVPDTACSLALFVQPLGRRLVALVRVTDDAGPDALAFHVLALPRTLYADLAGDPFHVAEQLPPVWQASADLPSLEWTAPPPPRRSVDDVRRVLNVVAERTQLLLGGVQALVDGGRLAFARKRPDPDLVRDLWALLPEATRCELWPTTFAYGNALRFHIAVVPEAQGPAFAAYVPEADMGDYPEGRYEFALQKAAEESDQAEIDGLFARRSRGQMLRLAVGLLAAFVGITLFLAPGSVEEPALPPPAAFSVLDDLERGRLAARLQALARKHDLRIPEGSSEKELRQAVVALDRQVEERWPSGRQAGDHSTTGPVQRQLRVLLWKLRVADYDTPNIDPAALVDRLDAALSREATP